MTQYQVDKLEIAHWYLYVYNTESGPTNIHWFAMPL